MGVAPREFTPKFYHISCFIAISAKYLVETKKSLKTQIFALILTFASRKPVISSSPGFGFFSDFSAFIKVLIFVHSGYGSVLYPEQSAAPQILDYVLIKLSRSDEKLDIIYLTDKESLPVEVEF